LEFKSATEMVITESARIHILGGTFRRWYAVAQRDYFAWLLLS
jgi:hypothetical protein